MNTTRGCGLLPLLLLGGAAFASGQDAFIHPGLLQSQEDLVRLRRAVAAREEPIYSGFEVFQRDPQSRAGYLMRGPFAEIGRNPAVHVDAFDHDANAAYQCAIMGFVTGEPAYTEKSREILDGWALRLRTVSGADAVLMASLGPFKLINAAEILRHTDSGWTDSEAAQFERMLWTAIYPALREFAPFANGNWDAGAIKTLLAMGVFCGDRSLFERALRYYVDGPGDGRLTHYIYANGQCQESGRDEQHTQLGLAHLGDCCEIAWHQGLDLYGYDDNRLLRGFEFTAQYCLGGGAPFVPDLDRTGKYAHSVIAPRGALRPVYEEIFNHYVNRRGLSAPILRQAVEQVRPEGPAQGADHPGFGTLLFAQGTADVEAARAPSLRPAAPGGLVAHSIPAGIRLSWVASVGASDYTVERARAGGGPFAVIAAGVKTAAFEDPQVEPGGLYRYAVLAANPQGSSPLCIQAQICAGLPPPWTNRDVGAVAAAGAAESDGAVYSLEGAGTNIGGTSDSFQFLYTSEAGDQTLAARLLPQTSSQSAETGLMMRESLAPDAAEVSLLMMASAKNERPDWAVHLIARTSAGAATADGGNSGALPPPLVTYGRVVQPVWLRLVRTGDTFTGWISPDGAAWKRVAEIHLTAVSPVLSGLVACSRLTTVGTSAEFDHVTAP